MSTSWVMLDLDKSHSPTHLWIEFGILIFQFIHTIHRYKRENIRERERKRFILCIKYVLELVFRVVCLYICAGTAALFLLSEDRAVLNGLGSGRRAARDSEEKGSAHLWQDAHLGCLWISGILEPAHFSPNWILI